MSQQEKKPWNIIGRLISVKTMNPIFIEAIREEVGPLISPENRKRKQAIAKKRFWKKGYRVFPMSTVKEVADENSATTAAENKANGSEMPTSSSFVPSQEPQTSVSLDDEDPNHQVTEL